MAEKELSLEIKKPGLIVLLVILSIFLFFELRAMISSPIAFGDEGFHTALARYFGEQKDYPQWIPIFGSLIDKNGFHFPPMLQLLEGSFVMIFGYQETLIKFLTPFTATIVFGLSVFLLTKKLFNTEVAFIAAIISVAVPSYVTYSVLLYRDIIFTLYFTLFALTLILALNTNEKKYWILSGVFAAFSVLSKTPGFAAPLIVGVLFLYNVYKHKNLLKPLKEFLPFILVFFLVSVTFFLRNLVFYGTPSCSLPFFYSNECSIPSGYKDKFQYEGRTVQVGTEASIFKINLINYLNFAYGSIWFVPLTFFLGLFFLLYRKSETDLAIIATFILFLVPVLYFSEFGGRAEDAARWFLPLVPIMAIISGNYLEAIFSFIKKHFKYLALIVFIAVIVASYKSFDQKLVVMQQVKQFSPAFFEACDWIKQNTSQNASLGAVIWGGATAYNCERDVRGGGADVILSKNATLVLSLLKVQGATHVFIQKFSIGWGDEKLTERYPISFVEFLENNPQYFKKTYENGPSLDQCRQVGGCDGTLLYEIKYSEVNLIPLDSLIQN